MKPQLPSKKKWTFLFHVWLGHEEAVPVKTLVLVYSSVLVTSHWEKDDKAKEDLCSV